MMIMALSLYYARSTREYIIIRTILEQYIIVRRGKRTKVVLKRRRRSRMMAL